MLPLALLCAPAVDVAPRFAACRRCHIVAALPSFVSDQKIAAIGEAAFVDAANSMAVADLTLPAEFASGPVRTTYLKTNVAPSSAPPLLLLHGFDISSLEYRRLLPLLEAEGLEAYAPCVAGWGFTDTANLKSVGVDAKRAQFLAFLDQVMGGRPAVVVGASLGASMAVDLWAARPEAVASLAFLDPGMYTPAPPVVPEPVGRLLIENVIGADGVRESIAKQAYFEKEAQTDDAIAVGMLHVARDRWADDSTAWLLGGGYDVADAVVDLGAAGVPTLTLWGREDEVILAGGDAAGGLLTPSPLASLLGALPATTFRWVERSGHTPHLEQPAVTARAIAAFARGEPVPGDGDAAAVVAAAERWEGLRAWAASTARDAGARASAAVEELLKREA